MVVDIAVGFVVCLILCIVINRYIISWVDKKNARTSDAKRAFYYFCRRYTFRSPKEWLLTKPWWER